MNCLTCGGPVHRSVLRPQQLAHDNDLDWLSKAAGGAHPVRVEHAAAPESPVIQRHPGGKDGMYRSYCICGYVSGFDTMRQVNAALQQHITDKDWSPTK